MSIKTFLQFVEIQTKPASVIPFLLGTLYSLYRYKSFKPENFLIMFISMFTFDMTTTAINNYLDFRKARQIRGVDAESKNIIIKGNIKEKTAIAAIFILLLIATIAGIILTFKTDIIVLLVGAASFFIGIIYTFGPTPISRTPFGELFSGIFMGFIITFLSVYVHIYDKNIVTMSYIHNILSLRVNVIEVICIFMISIPAITGIANIMLANNICDVEEDIVNKRFTLPYYIGRDWALVLFSWLYYVSYLDIIVLCILKIAPLSILITLFTLIPVSGNLKKFKNRPVKSETFVLSVKNFITINMAEIIGIGIAIAYSSIKF